MFLKQTFYFFSGGLWERICKKNFPREVREEFESWRELYERCTTARKEKLDFLAERVQQSYKNVSCFLCFCSCFYFVCFCGWVVVVVELVLEGALRAVHHRQERETGLFGREGSAVLQECEFISMLFLLLLLLLLLFIVVVVELVLEGALQEVHHRQEREIGLSGRKGSAVLQEREFIFMLSLLLLFLLLFLLLLLFWLLLLSLSWRELYERCNTARKEKLDFLAERV
jgi:hypothetical protein